MRKISSTDYQIGCNGRYFRFFSRGFPLAFYHALNFKRNFLHELLVRDNPLAGFYRLLFALHFLPCFFCNNRSVDEARLGNAPSGDNLLPRNVCLTRFRRRAFFADVRLLDLHRFRQAFHICILVFVRGLVNFYNSFML